MFQLLSHLSHIEIATPDVETSVAFYERRFGLRVVDRDEHGSAYLRCWGDHYRYSLIVSPGPRPALVTMAWRTASDDALDEAARRIEAEGVAGAWCEPHRGRGRAYRFTAPWGHPMELYWEVERYVPDAEHRSTSPDRPERRADHAVAPRFLDHVTVAASDVRAFAEWHRRVLGFRIMAYTELEDRPLAVFGVLTTNEKSHDLGVLLDASGIPGRVNHVAFWIDSHDEITRAADVLLENGTGIEFGPSVHGIGEQIFLYLREPSGMRIELNTGGYRNYVPDWTPAVWKPSLGANDFYRNGVVPLSMAESFPADPASPSATEEGVLPGTEAALLDPGDAPGGP